MRKGALILLGALVMLAAAIPASAKTVTIKKYYEGSGVGFTASFGRNDPTCSDKSCTATKDGRIELGKVRFDPVGGSRSTYTMTIKVKDDYDPYGTLTVSVCEDTTQNGSCGTDDAQWRKACIANGKTMKLYKVKKTSAIIVNLQGFYGCTQYVNDIPDKQGMTTSGVVYLSYVT